MSLLGRFSATFCGIYRDFAFRRIILWRDGIGRLTSCFIAAYMFAWGDFFLNLFVNRLFLGVAWFVFFYLECFVDFFAFLYFIGFIIAFVRANRFDFGEFGDDFTEIIHVVRGLFRRFIISVRGRIGRVQRFSVRARAYLSVNRFFRATRVFALNGRSEDSYLTWELYFRVRLRFLRL